MYYKLDENKNVVQCTLKEWCDYTEGRTNQSKHVGDNNIDGKRISTIFLGLPYGYYENAPLYVFETIVFDDGSSIYEKRYSTWKEADEGHQRAIEWVRDG